MLTEFYEAHLLSREAIDPFGLVPHVKQERVWKEAKEVDALFSPKVFKGALKSTKGMFYCSDCDSFIRCSLAHTDAYIRCFGMGDHCVRCG